MGLQILIAHPDEKFLSEAKEYFTGKNYQVNIALNGRDAQLMIYKEHFFSVILSLDVRNHSGLQVINFIKQNHPSLKVILLMEKVENYFEDFEIAKAELAKIGIIEVYLNKDASFDVINRSLEDSQNYTHFLTNLKKKDSTSDEVEVTGTDDQFTAIKITEFIGGQNVLFDVFIRLREGKYVKILHAGDRFLPDRITKYKENEKTQYLYFSTAERNKYIQLCRHTFEKILKKDQIPTLAKVTLAKNMTEKYIEEIYTEGIRPQVLEQGKALTEDMYNLIQSKDDLYKVLRDFQSWDPNAYSHAFLVSLFANMIVKQFDWHSKMTVETLGMAAMLHDIGKMKLPKELLVKKIIDMTPQELEEYQKHPQYGFDILLNINSVKPAIKQIVLQHHECINGSGFPNKTPGTKIFTLAKILILANNFCDFMVAENKSPIECLKLFISDQERVTQYNKIILENFLKVFSDPKKNKQSTDSIVF